MSTIQLFAQTSSSRSFTLPQPPFPPDDLTAVAARICEKSCLQLVVVNEGLGLEDDPLAFELGPFGRNVINPQRQMTDPALI